MAREMKDSGIEWIGEIPKEWKIVKMNIICSVITDYVASGSFASLAENVKYLDEPDYAMLIRIADISKKGHVGKPVYINEHAYNFLKNSNLFGGEIIIPNIGGVGEAYIVPKLYDKMSLAPNSIMIRTNYEDKYYYYFFNCEAGARAIKQISQSTAQEKFNKTDFRQIRGLIPQPIVQKKIVAYLDVKCDEIDSILTKTRASIEEYKKLKQAVITQAVTKGIRGDRAMKDSGIEWIGEIPEEWYVKKLRYLGRCQNGISKSSEYFGVGYPFVSYGDVYRNYQLPEMVTGLIMSTDSDRKNYSVIRGDVLFTRTSETIEEVGFSSVCLKTIECATFAGFVIRFRPHGNELLPEYSKYYFRSDIHRRFFVKEMNLVTRASLGQELLKKLPVILPSLKEQEEIVNYLDQKCSAIDELITKKEQYLFEIENYKKSLIYEYVTGKKEVPCEVI